MVYITVAGKAASVADMCITPTEFKGRMGDFGEYCPVSLSRGELVDCSTTRSLKYAAEFRGEKLGLSVICCFNLEKMMCNMLLNWEVRNQGCM